jgi:hypothetical protein
MLENAPLWKEHDPRQVADRLIAVIAPIVREIAVHSPGGTELALKRLAADKRREEVFVSKASLVQKLAPVPERLRPLLGPLLRVLESVGSRGTHPSQPRAI